MLRLTNARATGFPWQPGRVHAMHLFPSGRGEWCIACALPNCFSYRQKCIFFPPKHLGSATFNIHPSPLCSGSRAALNGSAAFCFGDVPGRFFRWEACSCGPTIRFLGGAFWFWCPGA